MTNYPETRASLILQVKDAANHLAWEEFVELYRPVIHRTALRKGMQAADAHDLTQQVLMAVASAVGRWEKSGSNVRFRHWLRRITRNAIINALTRRPLDQAIGILTVDEIIQEASERNCETGALIQLEYRRELFLRAAEIVRDNVAPETWQAFELTTISGFTNTEAAERLGKSIGTIYAARSRVMKRLRSAVAEIEESQT